MSEERKTLFRHEMVTDRLVRIFDVVGDIMYLVIGDRRAAMLDTGYGIGDLLGYVRRFTDLPVIALLTHGHRDHAMGDGQFESYMSPLDNGKYESDARMERRRAGMDRALERKAQGLIPWAGDFGESDWQPTLPVSALHPISEGQAFDLGGVTVEAYNVRGHSDGSMVFLMPELRVLNVGDACGFNTRIFCRVSEYMEDLEKVQRMCAGRYDTVIRPHESGELPAGVIEGTIAACRDVLAGTDDKIPFVHGDSEIFGGRDMRYAKEIVRDEKGFRRTDGGVGGLVYDSALI